MTDTIKSLALPFLILGLLFAYVSLNHQNNNTGFKEISAAEFKNKYKKSYTAANSDWIYMGNKKGYHYLIQRWSNNQHLLFKVSENTLKLNLHFKLSFTINKRDWVNIKQEHLVL